MSNAIDQEIDALLWRHFLQVEAERKNDSGTAVHAPEEHPDPIFGRLRKAQRVAVDYRRGQSIKINSTPTVFVNGREVPRESTTPEGIRMTIDAALKETGR